MTTTPPAHRAVWLDDDFGTPRETALLKPYETWLMRQGLELDKVNRLEDFARKLQHDIAPILLIIDVKLNFTGTFNALGFDDVRILRLDAGVQIAALIATYPHPPGSPHHWMERHRRTPVLLLSMSNIVATILGSYFPLDEDRRHLTVVQKQYDSNGTTSIRAPVELEAAIGKARSNPR